ncbi:uncharacterized protein C8R40DRAFT_1064654 [Lentinula edodes]|uniref:uncharacterized protein n=1 Tax=Lentinula edodes TaxID=5353 RepID=UPI001E8D11DB|nr:uncharacterized protein C8R40DRAFT_1064654 [Lentinula edodes]KAH7880843.1 hypothetical protein C8R40DRAFT_1064654 [Lentinula edodes]KAJ3884200.1 hypothetical protein GG344DRAFT_84408 [Lentinula edodes]
MISDVTVDADLTYKDGLYPHPSDSCYDDPTTHIPPSPGIRNCQLSPKLEDFSFGYRARESFSRLLISAYAAAIKNHAKDEFLRDVMKLWLCLFPVDLLPDQSYQAYKQSGRLTMSEVVLPFTLRHYQQDLSRRFISKNLPDTPDRCIERDTIVHHTLLKHKIASDRQVDIAHRRFDRDLPRDLFHSLLLKAIEDCLDRGVRIHESAVTCVADWRKDLQNAFMHWFYHQRMPQSFIILYPPFAPHKPFREDLPVFAVDAKVFWRPPHIPPHPHIPMPGDSETELEELEDSADSV